MTEFNPPISKRDTEELIAIANSTNEDWQDDARQQAIKELKARNISKEKQNRVVAKWEKEIKKAEEAYRRELIINATEKYSIFEILKIVTFAPLYLVGKGFDYDSIWSLRRENYLTKVKQRILAIIIGLFIWIFVINISFNISKEKILEEIENVDISEWEENRIKEP